MFNVKLVIQYDGSGFHGWQVQPNARTIQEELLKAIRIVTRQNVASVQSSGRTDAGVHARAQVCNFKIEQEVDLNLLKISISAILKNEVSVLSAEYVDLSFHALRDVKLKQYCYKVLNRAAPPVLDKGQVLHITKKLDPDYIKEMLVHLLGKHDFKSFCAADSCAKTTVREITRADLDVDGDYLIFRFEGKGFLKNMIRIIMGTVIDLALGKELLTMSEIIAKKDRSYAGRTSAAHALCLEWVRY